MPELRILTVIESLGRGGAEQALVNVLPALKGLGYAVEVATLWGPDTLAPDLEAAGVPVHRLGLNHRWNLAQGVPRLSRLCRERRYDVVHAHLFFSGLYASLIPVVGRGPARVATFHNLGYDSYPADTAWRKVRKRIDGFLMRHAMGYRFAVSTAVARHYERHLGLPPVAVLPNGFPTDRVVRRPGLDRRAVLGGFGLSADDFVLVLCGRFVHEKGHRFFLEALESLGSRGLNPRAILIGDGPLREGVEAEIRRRGLGDRVRIRPSVPHAEVLDVIQASDVLVMASTHEGFPLTPAEAMLVGTPVVATRVGGLPDLIEDGVSGMLVAPGEPEALADAIATLMAEGGLRARLALAGRDRIEGHFSADSHAARLAETYEGLVSGRDKRSAPGSGGPKGVRTFEAGRGGSLVENSDQGEPARSAVRARREQASGP